MNTYKIEKIVEINKLRFRLESLAKRASSVRSTAEQIEFVRFKPFFKTYKICTETFKSYYPDEFEKLDFEELPLYAENGKEGFTNKKLSTLINQSEELISILKGELYPYENYLKIPGNITIKWLLDNANLKFWLKILSCVIFIFLLGVSFSQTNLYKNIAGLFKKENIKTTTHLQSDTTIPKKITIDKNFNDTPNKKHSEQQ